ncbi:hypothetical protein [Azospirillum isscasi]|uniref:Uncharacterized protein n=1 Tax=Azospirillum isscasi TaxID=3053926 RepID=A0ABU0WAF2_9PROT|nr:hypothetical protein [Azospirillum isscasi]MDQ2101072.1 hypothetical protein [Azospirillum isscasi]
MPSERPSPEASQPSQDTPEPLLKLGDGPRPAAMPDSLAAEVAGWRFVLWNPAAASFYSRPGTPWQAPPEGCLRASDRWNLDGAFATDRPVENGAQWAVARFEGGVWRVESCVPAAPRPAVRDLLRLRVERLTAARRWTHGDLELLQSLLDGGTLAESALLAGDEGRARSLRSLKALHLASAASGADPELPDEAKAALADGAEAVVWLGADAREIADGILSWHTKKQARTAARLSRGAEAKRRGDDMKDALTKAVQRAFPRIPREAAAAAAARLAPGVQKLGRMPALQPIVDAVAEVRLERWRQAVASEPEVAKRLQAMEMRGDPNRALKRYRDQRAVERAEAELKEWRGDLGPVLSRRLGW